MNDKAKPEPAARQFQGRDGVWHNFIDERHLQNTVEDGSWPLRNLYTQEAIDTLRAEIATLRAENESLREQRNHIGLCIGHALRGGKKDDHEAGLSERMNAIRALIAERNEWRASRIAYANEFPLNADGEPDVVNVHANIRSLKAQLAEAQAALKTVMRNAELSKEPCGPDPESPAAIRNGKFAGLASIAAQGLGMVRGPSLTEHLVEAQKDAEPAAQQGDNIAVRVCRSVAELPDRDSPEGWPEAMLVTHEELHAIVLGALADAMLVARERAAP